MGAWKLHKNEKCAFNYYRGVCLRKMHWGNFMSRWSKKRIVVTWEVSKMRVVEVKQG